MSSTGRSAQSTSRSPSPETHISGRLHALYDAFFEDAHRKRMYKQVEKQQRMAELSRLMHEPATAENAKNLSPEEKAALMDAVAQEMAGGHADAKALNEALQEKRARLKAESKRKEEEEAARIARENAALAERLRNTKAATDNDVSDDASGAARRRAKSRRCGGRPIRRRWRGSTPRVAGGSRIRAATDDDVTDDAAGAGRRAAAKASKDRKAAEAAQLAAENAAYKNMIATTGAATDNDVTDDETGAARRAAARESKARKEAGGAARGRERREGRKNREHGRGDG